LPLPLALEIAQARFDAATPQVHAELLAAAGREQAVHMHAGEAIEQQQRRAVGMEAIKISWSGRKRCYDNILVERLWRTVKYEEVYLHAYGDGWETEISLARFLWRYCHVRPHSSLGGKTPHQVYTETELCSSRPGLTMSGAKTVQ
jgi:putative transposase